MKKNLFFVSLVAVAFIFLASLNAARAAAPTLALSSTGDGDNVQINVTGDPNASVLIYYQKNSGAAYLDVLGKTNASGSLSMTVSTATYGIAPNSSVYVKINNASSSSVAWPYNTLASGGAITINQTGLVLTVGQTSTLSVTNNSGQPLYLLNNSNPQIANVNINNNQITLIANAYGQTVVTLCALGTTSNCASTYLTVQNSGAQALTFSQTNLTIAYGQSSTVSILNGTGNYTILNNSNPSVISSSLSGSTITLNANNTSGTAAITVCAVNMSSCGIINASAGTTSSSSLVFNQTNPSLLIGQNLNILISGGSSYSISSNSNSSVVTATITNTNNLALTGGSAGSSIITVCANNGNCGSITATVSYSTSGPISLSQNNLWLQVGQAVSVTVSGGTFPYSLSNDSKNNAIFQASLNNNILTLTGVGAGSGNLDVCSAAGACVQLSVLVNGVSSSTQLTFSNNNLTLNVGGSTDVSLFGAGGYYISSSNNQNVASFVLNNNKITVKALSSGNANATICQNGGQCGIIYAAVSSNNTSNAPLAFSRSNPAIGVGESLSVAVSGGANSNYYISANSNPTMVQASINGGNLIVLGKNIGSTVITVCAATNSCNSLSVKVELQPSSDSSDNSNPGNADTHAGSDDLLQKITREADILDGGDVNSILNDVSAVKNASLETSYLSRYVDPLLTKVKLGAAEINNLDYFVVYGTPSTLKLGAGERAGVLGSYLQAYSKLPQTAAEWSDILKISSGRWPGENSTKAEAGAKAEFLKVYDRPADMKNSHDANAVTIIAYGLRPSSRNTASEKQAIKSFRAVYAHSPISPLAWNIVRAIAYSGASK